MAAPPLHPELMPSLRQLVRGLELLFWALPFALVVCVQEITSMQWASWGVLPLVLAAGAGSEVRNAMGITVFTGMLGVTLFGLLLTPVFYVALRKLAGTSLVVEQPAAQQEEKSNV